YFRNKGRNSNGTNFIEIDNAYTIAANSHFLLHKRYMDHMKKNNITPSKCRFPVSSKITNGFKKYQKMRWVDLLSFCNNLRAKYRIPRSDKIIMALMANRLPTTLFPDTHVDSAKINWFNGG